MAGVNPQLGTRLRLGKWVHGQSGLIVGQGVEVPFLSFDQQELCFGDRLFVDIQRDQVNVTSFELSAPQLQRFAPAEG